MKHLFLITNTMTRLVADAIINKEGLDGNHIAFLYTPLWSDPQPLKKEFVQIVILPPVVPLSNAVGKPQGLEPYESYQRQTDDCIESIIRTDEFEVYLPTLLTPEANLLVSHPNCVKYHIVEGEYGGDHSFGFDPKDNINWVRGRQLRLLGLPRYGYVTDIPFHTDSPKFGSMYAASEDTFVRGTNVKVVDVFSQNNETSIKNENTAFLLMTDSYYLNKKFTYRILQTFLDYLFFQHFIGQGFEHLICVWDQTTEKNYAPPIQLILDRYGKDMTISKMDAAVFVSQLKQFQGSPLFFLDSEFGFLAARHGYNVYSTASILSALNPAARSEFALSNHRKKRAAQNIPELGTEQLELWVLDILRFEIADIKKQVANFTQKQSGEKDANGGTTWKQRTKRFLKRILPASVINWLRGKESVE